MEKKGLKYSPALIKIFDEILVNAADNKQRDKTMSSIDVSVVSSKGGLRISIRCVCVCVYMCVCMCVYTPKYIHVNIYRQRDKTMSAIDVSSKGGLKISIRYSQLNYTVIRIKP
jgi:hypothetical protein